MFVVVQNLLFVGGGGRQGGGQEDEEDFHTVFLSYIYKYSTYQKNPKKLALTSLIIGMRPTAVTSQPNWVVTISFG